MQWLGVSVRRQLRNFTGAPAEALTLTRPVRDQASAVNAGWNFTSGALQHGPVLGVVAQRIDVDGYGESDPTLSSSLAFADQNFD